MRTARDWASDIYECGSLVTKMELIEKVQRDALEAAIAACRKPEQDECMTGHVSECIRAIEALKP